MVGVEKDKGDGGGERRMERRRGRKGGGPELGAVTGGDAISHEVSLVVTENPWCWKYSMRR